MVTAACSSCVAIALVVVAPIPIGNTPGANIGILTPRGHSLSIPLERADLLGVPRFQNGVGSDA